MTAKIIQLWPLEEPDAVNTLTKVELACRLLREASNEAINFQNHNAATVFFNSYCVAAYEAEKWMVELKKAR